MPAEFATALEAPDLGEFAALPDAAPTGMSSRMAMPDLGEFNALPGVSSGPADLGEFAALPEVPRPPGDETARALAETPIVAVPTTVARRPETPDEPDSFWDTLKQNFQGLIPAIKSLDELSDQPLVPAPSMETFLKMAKSTPDETAIPSVVGLRAGSTAPVTEAMSDEEATGVLKGTADFTSGLTSGKNVALLATLAGAPALVGRAIALGFSAQGAKHIYDESKQLAGVTDPAERARAMTSIVLNGAMVTAGGIAGLRPPRKTPERPKEASQETPAPTSPTATVLPGEAAGRASIEPISNLPQEGKGVTIKTEAAGGAVIESPAAISLPKNEWTTATLPELKAPPATSAEVTQPPLGVVAPGTAQLQKAGGAIAGTAGRIKGAVTKLKEFHDYRRARLNWSARNQASSGEIHRAATEIVAAVPNMARREGITNWIQAAGDATELAARAGATKNLKLRKGYEAASKLTPPEVALAGKIRDTYEILRQRAESHGIEIQRIENYVNQIWDRNPLRDFAASSNRKLSTNIRFAKQRFHESFFHGEQAGLKPATKDIAKLLPIYMNEVNNAISSKQFVAEMAQGKASDGRPLLAPRGGGTIIEAKEGQTGAILNFPGRATAETADYKVMNQPALHQWKWVGEENGKTILLKGDLAVHPEAYGHLKNVLGQSAIREWYQSPSETALGAIPKAATKLLVDDVQQIGKATMLGFLSPFHQVQEGTHAIGHRVNPFGGLPKIDLTKPNQMDAARHGLMLLPDRVSSQQFREGLDGSSRNLLSNVLGKAGGKVGAKIKEWADGYQHYLFHEYIPGLKLKTYEHILERNSERFAGELKSGAATIEQVKFLSAEQSNAAYGHLNYADMGRNPTLQHIAQTFLLAPDFLEARGRFAGQAAGGVLSKVGREQFAAIATLGATQWILARALNKTLDDDYHWDEPFGVIVGARRYTMRSVPEDIYKATHQTRRFISGRLSPLVGRGLLEGLSGVNYRSEPTEIGDTLTNIIGGMIPLTVQPMTRGLSETGRDNPVSPFEQLLGSLGLHVSRYSPVSRVYPLAKEWIETHGEEFGIDKKRAVYPISKYQQLRYALEDGDGDRARTEARQLMESEKLNHFELGKRLSQSLQHNFTGGGQEAELAFQNSLDSRDRALYDAAVERRKLLLKRFDDLDGL